MENNQQDSLQMHLDYDGGNILRETARWSRFLSIMGAVTIAVCLLAFGLAGNALVEAFTRLAPGLEGMAGLGSAIIIVVVLVFMAVFGFIVYMLYRFSTLTRRGVEERNQAVFAEGMKCLRIYFLVNGILAVLSLLSNLLSISNLFHS
ncbi:MAG TPA: hypothetical protein VGM31_05780 [Puia sp.]|jgi:hypothetical protein